MLACLLSSAAAALPCRGWARRSKQRNIIAVVLADEFHNLDHAWTCVGRKSARGSPLSSGLFRIFVNDFIEDGVGAGARQAFDGVKAFAGLLNSADRMLSVIGNGI